MVWGLALTTIASADDTDDVKAAVQAIYEALNKGDANGFTKLILPGSSSFPRTGELLTETNTIEDFRSALQSLFDAGLKFNVQVHHLNVKIYGNNAIATYYTIGDWNRFASGTHGAEVYLHKPNIIYTTSI